LTAFERKLRIAASHIQQVQDAMRLFGRVFWQWAKDPELNIAGGLLDRPPAAADGCRSRVSPSSGLIRTRLENPLAHVLEDRHARALRQRIL
jgi:hypothetical protein